MGETETVVPRDETWRSARGGLTITRVAPHVMLFTYSGHLTVDVVPFVEASVDRVCAAGIRPHLFVDLEDVSGYDAEYRRAVSAWGLRNLRRFAQARFLVRSRLVAMGVSLSTLISGGFIQTTTKRDEFEAAMRDALEKDA